MHRWVWLFFPLFASEKPPNPIEEKTSLPLRIIQNSDEEVLFLLRTLPDRWEAFSQSLWRAWEGIPYGSGGAGTPPDKILINFRQMDCVTAVENFLALRLAQQEASLESFAHALGQLRYYTLPPCRWEDRIHYLLDAFHLWQKRGWGYDLTPAIGIPIHRKISYLSRNKKRFAGFKDWEFIRQVENRLSEKFRYYLPKEAIDQYLAIAKEGDLIAFVSQDTTLDVSHVGVIHTHEEEIFFSHASSIARKIVYKENLCAYLQKREKIIGVVVFRPTL
ncbi:MAG: N-acetylmuramoyl-L-alanine amidase-like domain-containing protein [Bacteroidia bacterium]